MVSAFANAIQFLGVIGIYDVVLPFLITFTIVFAILEKTKILGTEKVGTVEYTKKNLNSLVAFCTGFFVVASSQLVSIINEVFGQVVILLLMSVMYLLLIGSFFKNGEEVFLEKGGWRLGFMIAMLIGIILIFANAIHVNEDMSALTWAWDQVFNHFDSNSVSSIVLILIILIVMFYITSDRKPNDASKKEGSK